MALPAPAIRRPHASPTPHKPLLRVVRPTQKQRARIPFFALCVAILAGSMLGALVLNTSMSATSYHMHSTQLELGRTLQSNQEQAATLDRLSAPARLAEKATALGMVQGEGVTYIDLSTGTLIETVTKAKDR